MIITKLNPFVVEFLPTNSTTPISIDAEDFGRVKELETEWCVHFRNSKPTGIYSTRCLYGNMPIAIHRFLMQTIKKGCPEIDHQDRNIFHNRKSNLRVCSSSQNQSNKSLRKDNTSGCRGISFYKRTGTWRTRIHKDGKEIALGYYKTKDEAIKIYNEAAIKYHKNFASLN